ncbi:hypothetical protein Tco_0984563 [Tanacetum coccineum]
MDKKKCTNDIEVFRDILQICLRLPKQEFVVPPSSDLEIVSFIKELGYTGDIDSVTKHDSILGSLRFVSKTKEYQVYRALIPVEMTNRNMRKSTAYKTYLAFATGATTPKKARKFKKLAFAVKEPTEKPAARRQSAGVQIRDNPGMFVSKKKAPAKA